MKSEARFHRPPIKFYASLGLFAAVALIVVIVSSMILLPDVWRVGFYSLFALTGVGGIGWIARQSQQIRHQAEMNRLDRARARYLLIPKTTGAIIDLDSDAPLALLSGPAGMVINAPAVEVSEPAPPLLSQIDRVQRCLIVGPASDSGKTTLLQWIISVSRARHRVVFDPHGSPGKWPASTVIGPGQEYGQIEDKLASLIVLMKRRYQEIAQGVVAEEGHERIAIFIDEWRAIVKNTSTAAGAISDLLTEGRKASIHVFVAAHSERAKPLGLEGEYDLKDGFAIIRLTLVNGHRSATLDFGAGEFPVTLPGPFAGARQPYNSPLVLPEPEPEQPTDEERAIVEASRQYDSYRQITAAVWGPDKVGTYYNEKIRAALDKWGREV